jgi:hypothetical protein
LPRLRLHANVDDGLRQGGSERLASTLVLTNLVSLGRRWSVAVALVTYTVMAVAMFSNTWVHPTTWSVGIFGDPRQMMWFLGWQPFAITHGQNPTFTNYIDYPVGVNLMWNSSVILPALVLGPLTQLAGPVLSYNFLMTVAVALSAWTAYLFIRRYVSSQVAAAVGGALYGFSPFMTAHSLAHPNLTVAFMPPILLLLLDEIVRVQRRRPLVSGLLLGLAGAAQLFIGEEVLASVAIVGFFLLCLVVALCADQVKSHLRHALLGLASAAVVFLVVTAVPVGFQFFGPQHLLGVTQPSNVFVSDALSFFVPSRLFLLAPASAVAISGKFTGNMVEDNSYVGVLLALLLAFIVVRYWRRLDVRLAALGAVLIAILSMGVTIHIAGRVSPFPVFTLGLVFPLLQRYLPGRLMLYLTFAGWLALSRLSILGNILPTRMMLYFYLLAGLLIAVWLDDMKAWQPQHRRLGWLAAAASLVLLVPAMPYPSTPEAVPAFFTGGAVSQIPAGSVVLVIPYSIRNDARAMVWQAHARMRFRMPEGYAFITDTQGRGERLSPPPSALQTETLAVAQGGAGSLTSQTRQQILGELKSWHVQTVVVGPMTNEQQEVDLFTSVLGRASETVDGVYVWWGVDALL